MSKALCVATKCTTGEQFIESFYRFCDEQTFFVATLNQRPIGLETPFSINLADRTPMLRGLCVVLDAWSSPANPFGRPGIRLGIKRLTPESEDMFAKLAQRRACQGATSLEQRAETVTDPAPAVSPPPIPVQPVQAVVDPPTTPVAMPLQPVAPVVPSVIAQLEQRTPGSDIVLPANPLMNLTDESLVGFVDCTLYEETGNFFRAPDADVAGGEALLLSDADLAEPPPPPDFTPTVPPQRPTPPPTTATPPMRATPPPMPAVAPPPSPAATTPPPQAIAPIEPMQPIARGRHNRTLMMAGGAAALTALIVFIAVGSSSDASTDGTKQPEPAVVATTPTPAPTPATTAEPAPTPQTDPLPGTATNDAPPEEDPPPAANASGAPLVGTGPCRLDVTTTPAGTKVVVDGKEIGPSPISIAGPCEKHKVDLIHPRYKQATQFVALAEGAPKKLDVTLIRPTHHLVIKTTPPGATISIQGRRAGTSPTTVALMGFSGIDVTIARPGFETVTKRVYSKTPTETLTVQLKRYKW